PQIPGADTLALDCPSCGGEQMRAISAALVLLSGTVLVAVGFAGGMGGAPFGPSFATGVLGAILVLLGLISWLVAFLVDKDRA
ncbi:MAG: hypothetical protein L0Z62_07625, partial [Gemmataceae bacterium]|nr:hypothetical protein [Gemmataceae bacterium]